MHVLEYKRKFNRDEIHAIYVIDSQLREPGRSGCRVIATTERCINHESDRHS